MPAFIETGQLDHVAPGKGATAAAGSNTIALFRTGGVVRAVEAWCLRCGACLAEGTLAGRIVACRGCDWRYDLDSGAVLALPALRLGRLRCQDCRRDDHHRGSLANRPEAISPDEFVHLIAIRSRATAVEKSKDRRDSIRQECACMVAYRERETDQMHEIGNGRRAHHGGHLQAARAGSTVCGGNTTRDSAPGVIVMAANPAMHGLARYCEHGCWRAPGVAHCAAHNGPRCLRVSRPLCPVHTRVHRGPTDGRYGGPAHPGGEGQGSCAPRRTLGGAVRDPLRFVQVDVNDSRRPRADHCVPHCR